MGWRHFQVEISAKFNQNIEELLEMILLVAEVQEQQNPQPFSFRYCNRSLFDKQKGPYRNIISSRRSLKLGTQSLLVIHLTCPCNGE